MNYAIKLYHEGNMTIKQICKINNISKSLLYRRLSEEKRGKLQILTKVYEPLV